MSFQKDIRGCGWAPYCPEREQYERVQRERFLFEMVKLQGINATGKEQVLPVDNPISIPKKYADVGWGK